MWDDARDAELRREVMAWLTVRSNDGADPVPSDDLRAFELHGERMPLLDLQRGIRKPAVLQAALSIRTVYTPDGRQRPYEDAPGPDGMLRYKWRGDDPAHAENRALRRVMENGLPLVWFFGVGPALYLPVFPVYVVGEEPASQQFVVDPDVGHGLVAAGSVVEEHLRRYVVTQTRRRLHQPVFRATVMRAYGTRCAVCSLAYASLLDAAHIVADADPLGIASVRNGLALCKIHHAAFDADILGVRPDRVIEIRATSSAMPTARCWATACRTTTASGCTSSRRRGASGPPSRCSSSATRGSGRPAECSRAPAPPPSRSHRRWDRRPDRRRWCDVDP